MRDLLVRLFLLPVLIGVLHTTASAQQPKRYNSLLWRITGPDLAAPSYLYGTMHVSNKLAFNLTEEFFLAFESCQDVAMEMDPDRWLPDMITSELFGMMYGMQMRSFGGSDLYNKAFGLEPPDRASLQQVLSQDPALVNDLLYRMTERGADHEENTFLDLFIYQCARKRNKQVHGLEEFEPMMELMMQANAAEAEDSEKHLRRRSADMMSGTDPIKAMEDAYRIGDLDRIDTLMQQVMPSEGSRRIIIDVRNRNFVNGMLPIMRERSLFTAVGAAHLPGDSGMVEMLRRHGYTVEAVLGRSSSRANAQRDKLDLLHMPRSTQEYAPEDGAFTMELSAPLYVMSDIITGGAPVLLSTDNVNGAYYSVNRMPTYAAFRGVSQQHVLAQLDSMLYESIPGRISKVERISSAEGWPGFKVHSVSRQGRDLWFRIHVSPTEIIIFKRTGKKSREVERDGQRAFESIRFTPPQDQGWSRWTPRMGGFHVDLPGVRSINEPDRAPSFAASDQLDRNLETQAYDPATDAHYMVLSATYADLNYLEEDTFELNVLTTSFADQFGLKRTGTPFTSVDGMQGLDATFTNANGDTVFTRVVLKGPLYHLLAMRGSSAAAARWFGSFGLEPLAYEATTEAIEDTLIHGSVRVPSLHRQRARFLGRFSRLYSRSWRERDEDEDIYGSSSNELSFENDRSPDMVKVRYYRMAYFEHEDSVKGMWDKVTERRGWFPSGKVTRSAASKTADGHAFDMMLTRPACSRGIRMRFILQGRCMWILSSCVDTAAVSPWVDAFYSTFTPSDTTALENIFESRYGTLLAWLNDADSAKFEHAQEAIADADLKDADALPLITWLNSERGLKLKKFDRMKIIGKVSQLHHPAVVPYLIKCYAEAGDTTDAQFDVLSALATNHDRRATAAYLQCMLNNTPLTTSKYQVKQAFAPFYDSLEIAVPLFPKIEELSTYEEYTQPIRSLKAALVEAGLLPSASYAPQKQVLLAKARIALKRATTKGDDTGYRYGRDDEDEYAEPINEYDYDRDRDRDYLRYEDGPINKKYLSSMWRTHQELVEPDTTQWPIDADKRFQGFSDELTSLQHLLVPFHAEPNVKALFDKSLACDEDEIAMSTALLLIDKKRPVEASFWKTYLDRADCTWWLYADRRTLGIDTLAFDSLLKDEEQLARAAFFTGRKDYEKDSIELVGTRDVETRFGPVRLYFFQSKAPERSYDPEPSWNLRSVGVFRDAKTPDRFAAVFSGPDKFNIEPSEVEEKMDEMSATLRYEGRKRWKEKREFDRSWMMD